MEKKTHTQELPKRHCLVDRGFKKTHHQTEKQTKPSKRKRTNIKPGYGIGFTDTLCRAPRHFGPHFSASLQQQSFGEREINTNFSLPWYARNAWHAAAGVDYQNHTSVLDHALSILVTRHTPPPHRTIRAALTIGQKKTPFDRVGLCAAFLTSLKHLQCHILRVRGNLAGV